MKKFIITTCAIILFGIISVYTIYFKGFYINFSKKEVTTNTRIYEKTIQVKQDNIFMPFTIKGVNLPSSIAGHTATEFAIDKDTYLRWFDFIANMGANSIRIYTIYNDDFYNALYEYNTTHETPLYLLQGIQVSSYANNSKNDAYSKDFYYSLKEDAIDVVDVIHGKKIISLNKQNGSGYYFKDVSPWLLGYIVGSDFNANTIAYTNHKDYDTSYQGTYITTSDNASAFEVLLAKVMDHLIHYETEKYGYQSLITFSSSTTIDPFEYDSEYASQIGKHTSINPNHIQVTDKFQAGFFASYQLVQVYDQFYNHFSTNQKNLLSERSITIQEMATATESYFKLLSDYHNMPVIINDFGFSTSRGCDEILGPNNEQIQGEKIVTYYQQMIDNDIQGAFISTWQDAWDRATWNTSYSVETSELFHWHDIQGKHTGFGLLGFSSNTIELDGSNKDWPSIASTITTSFVDNNTTNSYSIDTFYDESGLYLFIKNTEEKPLDSLTIALDITQNSGSTSYKNTLSFNTPVDFIIELSKESGRMLVQSRYESLRANYLADISDENAYFHFPDKDDTTFVPIYNICNSYKKDENGNYLIPLKYETYETGQLIAGNSSKNSLADYCYSNEGVELRIPWQLLNITNPDSLHIHDDYYEHYGVVPIKAEDFSIGIAPKSASSLSLEPISYTPFKRKEYKEYLKASYYIIQDSWRKIE